MQCVEVLWKIGKKWYDEKGKVILEEFCELCLAG